jgi:hypothetical protein
MRTLTALLYFTASAVIIIACKSGRSKLTSVRVEDSLVEMGTVSRADTLKHAFQLVNTGDVNLQIDTIARSCDCVGIQLEKKTTHPGDSIAVTLSFVIPQEESGQQIKTAIVQANVNRVFVPLRISYTVKP